MHISIDNGMVKFPLDLLSSVAGSSQLERFSVIDLKW